jgi:hypothetical protein
VLFSNRALNAGHLVLNRALGILCCTICGYGLRQGYWRHAARHHGETLSNADQIEIEEIVLGARNDASEMKLVAAQQPDIVQEAPIEGILLHRNGWKCAVCVDVGVYTTKQSSMRKHVESHHDHVPFGEAAIRHPVQSVFLGVQKKFVGVTGPAVEPAGPATDADRDVAILERFRQAVTRTTDDIAAIDPHRVDCFMWETKWYAVLHHHQHADLVRYTALPERGECAILDEASAVLGQYVREAITAIERTSHHLLQEIVSYQEPLLPSGFHGLESTSAIQAYTRTACR